MAVEVIKTIKGRRYRYLQKSYRDGGKVRTKSIYLGPADGPTRKAADEKYRQVLRDNVYKYGHGRPGARYAAEARARAQYARDCGFKSASTPPDTLAAERARWEQKISEAKSEEWRLFMERVEPSQSAQNAPGRTQAAPAKNFTVDDEIEARQATFDKAVDEYNAGTTAAPDDAPSDGQGPQGEPGPDAAS